MNRRKFLGQMPAGMALAGWLLGRQGGLLARAAAQEGHAAAAGKSDLKITRVCGLDGTIRRP